MRSLCVAMASLVVCVVGGAGCYESLTSIATPDKLVFYDELLGDFNAVEPATGRITLQKAAGNAYSFLHIDDKGVMQNKGALRVIKVGDDHFYELTAAGFATADDKPIYFIGRLEIGGAPGSKTLTGYAFKSRETLFEDPGVTSAEITYKDAGGAKTGRALSMAPAKLQAYLAAHASDMAEPTLSFKQSRPNP